MRHLEPRRLLAGPPLDGTAESYADHLERLGGRPPVGRDADGIIASLKASGLLGRGGAGFPVGRKWGAMVGHAAGRSVVVANGAEGEPGSAKDRVLMTHRPHLVIDGALTAARAIATDEVVFYVGSEHTAAVAAMSRAIEERRQELGPRSRLVRAPMGYVAGEASAAVHHIERGDPRPRMTPPRTSESGLWGRPTLVQNVESLAYAALIARYGDRWFRAAGRLDSPGTALVTLTGAIREEGVREIELGTTVGELAASAGATPSGVGAVVLGGYFGTWARTDAAWDLPLDPVAMRAHGLTFGCGIVGFLPAHSCGVAATARIMAFMAGESAGQCGPCVYGLGAIGDVTRRIAEGSGEAGHVADLERWTSQLPGRGACRHPDGAAQLMASALAVFGPEFAHHARTGRCSVSGTRVDAA